MWRIWHTIVLVAAIMGFQPIVHAQTVQVPGPSAALYGTPYYSCSSTFYVSATGSDLTGNGTSMNPWATLTKANSQVANNIGGECILVAPSQTAYSGVILTKSGSSASSSGYIVYRCMTMDGCTVNSNATVSPSYQTAGFGAAGTNSASYVIIDGFNIVGSNAVLQFGVIFEGSTNSGNTSGSHHDWVINSIVHGNGQAGIGFNNEDYVYAIHNAVYLNASAPSCNNGFQGSGIDDVAAQDINYMASGYMPTNDDLANPNALIGSFKINSTTWFHRVHEWNVVYNNYISPCSVNGNGTAAASDTDGNGIILDTFQYAHGDQPSQQNTSDYPNYTLIAFNIVLNNGGGGIHIFYADRTYVYNNTSYNNYLDQNNNATARAGIDSFSSYGNVYRDNISVAIPTYTSACYPNAPPYTAFNNSYIGLGVSGQYGDVFGNNISLIQGGNNSCQGYVNPPMYATTSSGAQTIPSGDYGMFNPADSGNYACVGITGGGTNMCLTDPKFVSVGGSTTGSDSSPPVGSNFALQSVSPAINQGVRRGYLPATSVDLGACYHTLTQCP